MGTTRIKVIDLSSDQKEIKTSRKHAEKLIGLSAKTSVKADAAKTRASGPGPMTHREKRKGEETKATNESKVAEVSESPSLPEPPATTDLEKASESPKKKSILSPAPKKRVHGKKYQEAAKLIDKSRNYPAKEALQLLAKTSLTRFDPTVEIHLNVSDKNIRAKINFPHPVGRVKKTKRYLIFSDKKVLTENTPSAPSVITKNIIWGNVSTIAEIESGKLKPGRDFDTVITTPGFMPHLAKVAKILGPKGMMPNPKNGTIQEDPTYALNQSDESYELKTDPAAPIIHTKIGKLSDKPGALEENLKALITAVGPTKIRKAVIKSTMSPAIKLDVTTIAHLA